MMFVTCYFNKNEKIADGELVFLAELFNINASKSSIYTIDSKSN